MQPDHSAPGTGQLHKTLRPWHVIIIGLRIIVSLWLDLNGRSLVLGGVWVALGALYLAWMTKAFRVPPPSYAAE